MRRNVASTLIWRSFNVVVGHVVYKQAQTRAQTIVVMGGTLGAIVAKYHAWLLILGFNQQKIYCLM